MEMSERIRELRKKHLHMPQTVFGEKLGVSRSVINNIESNALARPDQKLSLIKLMCKEFSVNEDWILNGTEPMFSESDTFSLDELARNCGASELELSIAKAYFELPQDVRADILTKLKDFVASVDLEPAKPDAAEQPPPPYKPKIAVLKAPAETDRAELERQVDEFAAQARAYFLDEKKREQQALSAKKSDVG